MTQVFLTSPTGSNQTYTSDATWNNASNSVECLGAGGSGGAIFGVNSGRPCATGGGGGEWRKKLNFSFATPGTTTATYQIGTGGTAVSRTTTGSVAGNAGGDTWFDGTTQAGSTVSGKGGGAGQVGSNTAVSGGTGGTGGTGADGSNAGGRGGNVAA